MEKPKEYKLKTIADMLEVVNEDNYIAFLKDFNDWLAFRMGITEAVKLFGDNDTEVKMAPIFHWIDDGKNDANITIQLKNK